MNFKKMPLKFMLPFLFSSKIVLLLMKSIFTTLDNSFDYFEFKPALSYADIRTCFVYGHGFLIYHNPFVLEVKINCIC